ncbi:unnamed protein product [Thlaspi arvense]|uniref:Uncharacterized protein n=1 Tax=Thlaspi arvense TaxID=13288 RepID=A0AAU9S2T7_THLAR|nr:unnamed protein product [Thlaspi arvense]
MRDLLMANEEVNPSIWAACAGVTSVEPLQGTVIYFPQGHVEQCTNSDQVRTLCAQLPASTYRISSVSYLADTRTDEVYMHLILNVCRPEERNTATVATAARPEPVAKLLLPTGFIKVLERDDIDGDQCSIDKACLWGGFVFPQRKPSVKHP